MWLKLTETSGNTIDVNMDLIISFNDNGNVEEHAVLRPGVGGMTFKVQERPEAIRAMLRNSENKR
jgi:hypothetical protein